MRFTLIKNVKQDKMMRPLLNGLLLFMLLYIIFDIFVKSETMGISTTAITTTLFGNADEFIDPMNASVFLESLHAQIFFLMMIVLTLSAVFIRLLHKKSRVILMINLLLGFALLTPIALLSAYFYSGEFISIYLFSFFSWHFIAFSMIVRSVWELNFVK